MMRPLMEDTMSDILDVGLDDNELNSEIDLLTDLMLLASESAGPLDPGTIDEALGIQR